MPIYNAESLKDQFAGLLLAKDSTLTPIVDILVREWFQNLPNQPEISDICRLYLASSKLKRVSIPLDSPKLSVNAGFQPNAVTSTQYYLCVYKGKLVSMCIHESTIGARPGERNYYELIDTLDFQGAEKSADDLFNMFREFVGQHSLDELVLEAAKKLRKVRIEFFYDNEMKGFYSSRKKKRL